MAATGPRSVAASSLRAATPRIAVTGLLSTMRLLQGVSHQEVPQILIYRKITPMNRPGFDGGSVT
jgi:hypothetical protein